MVWVKSYEGFLTSVPGVALWKERRLERLPFLERVLKVGDCGSVLEEEIERIEEERRAFWVRRKVSRSVRGEWPGTGGGAAAGS
jgi:hypothetical protein